jgi:speckle-type POZ protein
MAAPAAPAAAAASASVFLLPGDAAGSCTTGTTTLTRRGVHTHVWRLEGVTPADFRDAAAGDKLSSDEFSALGFAWRITMHPNGNVPQYAGNVGLFLKLMTANSTTPAINFELRINKEFREICSKDFSTFTPLPEGMCASWGFRKLVSHARLFANFDAYAPGGVLCVKVKMWQKRSEACPNPTVRVPLPRLGLELGALLASGEGADVTLLCSAERLAAHALLLRTRSPVFAAQLREGPMQADASAVPVPPDITPHTLRRLLHFLYTDELEPSSPEEATHLLNAADHYDLPRLFAICERALCVALSVDNAAETLTLADQHAATGLKDAALRFVAANAVAVMATLGWEHLQTSRPALITEALRTLATGAPPVPPSTPPAPADADDDGAAQRV